MSNHVMRLSLVLTAIHFLGGCAYFTNYTRSINLRDGSVAIDVKQRVVFSQDRAELDKSGQRLRTNVVVCAEPSPDALTVLGASGGLSINGASGKFGNASASLAESGASIGLRTQSIQLLRDAMYRLCEGYAGGAVSDSDFAAMQRRYQSTMMGLIAIEQLTGPIVAAQTMLTTTAAAQAGASGGDAAVDAAQVKADATADAVLTAQTEADTSQINLDTTRAELTGIIQKLAAEKEKKEPDQTVIDSLSAQVKNLSAQEKTQQNDLSDKKRRLEEAKRRRDAAASALAEARSKVTSSASGTGRLGDVAGATRDSNVAFASAVREIVTEINRSYSRDGCLTLLTELARTGSLNRVTTASSKSTEVQALQQRIAELKGMEERLDQEGMELAGAQEKGTPVPMQKVADVRAKYEQAVTERKFAEENLLRARQTAEREESAVRFVDGTTIQAVGVCQSILSAEKVDKDK